MRFLLIILMSLPGMAFAAGNESSSSSGTGNWSSGSSTTPPATTETTKTCKGTKVWDAKKKRCVNAQGSMLDSDTLYHAARELAYAGRYQDAQGVLREMPDQDNDLVLTYWGFTHRKLGNLELANMYYQRAIDQNPDNILARSYMGQGYVEEGRTDDAIAQWHEIKARGGVGSWAETSLRQAIRTGLTYSY